MTPRCVLFKLTVVAQLSMKKTPASCNFHCASKDFYCATIVETLLPLSDKGIPVADNIDERVNIETNQIDNAFVRSTKISQC